MDQVGSTEKKPENGGSLVAVQKYVSDKINSISDGFKAGFVKFVKEEGLAQN